MRRTGGEIFSNVNTGMVYRLASEVETLLEFPLSSQAKPLLEAFFRSLYYLSSLPAVRLRLSHPWHGWKYLTHDYAISSAIESTMPT